MKCPYQINVDCRYVDTSTMTSEKSCEECELYNNGICPTGCEKQTTVIVTSIVLFLIYLIL